MGSSVTSWTKHGRTWIHTFALALTTIILAACSSGGDYHRSAASAAELQAKYEQVVQTVLPSVVQIITDSATGSGVVYDARGARHRLRYPQ
jgi:hypothetical protein